MKELVLENNNLKFNKILYILDNIRIKECSGKIKNNKNIHCKDFTCQAHDNLKDIEIITGLWKAIYYLHIKLESNWKNGEYSIYNKLCHTDIIYCLQYDNEKIISGSRDSIY